ncbi:tetratricopeptide repeat protein [Actinomadura parmotrematis]|uniref:Tetratricopeptide repeat protein n=1 Tax=Actinomadura parmotrematis TaxID=2864039 RepID=A0ABS7G3D5_9ACTN|nr:tetratricopeptide repeat protein [Actinomadura parmotrematis]MBW8486971.1 tetratricopeptide repeat protein [Actinomadura parmotrematis]
MPERREGGLRARLRRAREAHGVPAGAGVAVGLGAYAGIAAQVPPTAGAVPVSLSVFSSLVVGGGTYLEARRRARLRDPRRPAVPPRRVTVVYHPADATGGHWVQACLRAVPGVEVGSRPWDAAPAGGWELLVLSTTWELLADTGFEPADPARLLVVRMEDCAVPPRLAAREIVDIGGADEAAASGTLLAALARHGVIGAVGPAAAQLPSAAGIPFPRMGPAVANLRPPDPGFVGRDRLLREVRERLVRGAGDGVAVTALRGLGGVGKSSTAVNYAHRYRRHYEIVWWLTADSPTDLRGSLLKLALALGVAEQADADQMIAELWAELRRRSGWLLIYDNADEGSELAGHWPPGGGHLLITSRLSDLAGLVAPDACLEVPPLDDRTAAAMLCEQTGRDEEAAALAVARMLGQLPLALAHAVAYVRLSGLTLEEYRQTLESRLDHILERFRPDPNEKPVAMTWSLSLRRANEQEPLALDLMRLWAMLAPDRISRDLLGPLTGRLPGAAGDPVAYHLAVQPLARYSLIRVDDGEVSVHRLVQAVVRLEMTPEEGARWLETATLALAEVFPERVNESGRWPVCSRLLAHVLAVHANLRRLERALPAGRPAPPALERTGAPLGALLHAVGRYLIERSGYDVAVEPLDAARALRARAHGERSEQVAETWLCQGIAQFRLADIEAARASVQGALDTMEAVRGPDDPALYKFLLWRCWVLMEFSELDGAYASAERGHRLIAEHCPPDDPRLPEIDDARATVRWRQGHFREAVGMMRGVVETLRGMYGEEDGRTLVAEGGLAYFGHDLGVLLGDREMLAATAERLTAVSDALADRFGDTHFRVIEQRKTLAAVLIALGDHAGAARLLAPVVATYRSTLGKHPSTVQAEKLYAVALAHRGEAEEALLLMREGLLLYEGLYGADHPYVAEILAEYGPVLAAVGRNEEAAEALRGTLTIVERCYGPGHPKLVRPALALAALPGVPADEAARLRERAERIRATA